VADYAGQTAEAVAALFLLGVVQLPGFHLPGSNLINTIPYIKNLIDPPIATMIDPFTGELMF
jgi:hypothetical protein